MSSLDCDDFGLNRSKPRNAIDCGRRKGLVPGAAAMAAWLALAPAAGAAVDEWALDPARTHISFSVDAIGFPRAEGEFHAFDGRISIDFEHPAMSRVIFRVEAGSIDAGSALLSDYLRGEPFFDTAHFAEIKFVSTKVEKIDEQTVRVAGELTMLGVTRPLSVDVEVHRQNAVLIPSARSSLQTPHRRARRAAASKFARSRLRRGCQPCVSRPPEPCASLSRNTDIATAPASKLGVLGGLHRQEPDRPETGLGRGRSSPSPFLPISSGSTCPSSSRWTPLITTSGTSSSMRRAEGLRVPFPMTETPTTGGRRRHLGWADLSPGLV